MEGLQEAITAALDSGTLGAPASAIQQAPAPAPQPAPAAAPAPAESATPEAPKTGLDALPDMNESEEANPSTGEQPQAQQEEASPQKRAWSELKKKATELDQVKPELEKLRQQLQEAQEKPSIPQEVEAELNELRQLRFAVELEKTPDWEQSVKAPSAEILNQFKQIADYYNVDYNDLVAAADDQNPLRRGKAIREFLANNEVEEVSPEVIALATSSAEKLHGIYAKMAELKRNSSEAYQSLEARRSMETEQQQMQREQAFSSSHKEIVNILEKKMPDLFKNPELAKAVKEAKPSDDPREQAFQVASSLLLAPLAAELKTTKSELAALKKQLAARSSATPGLGTAPAADGSAPAGPSLMDAIRATYGGA